MPNRIGGKFECYSVGTKSEESSNFRTLSFPYEWPLNFRDCAFARLDPGQEGLNWGRLGSRHYSYPKCATAALTLRSSGGVARPDGLSERRFNSGATSCKRKRRELSEVENVKGYAVAN